MSVGADVLTSASTVLQAYLRAYEKRRRSGKGVVFSGREANGLVALVRVRLAALGLDRSDPVATMDAVDALTREALAGGSRHEAAVDLAGVVWSEAFGVLPVRRPPLEQVEWVLESGRSDGDIQGVLSAAWRGCFLANAMPLLGWQRRPLAVEQLGRLTTAVRDLVGAFEPEPNSLSSGARAAFVAAELARLVGDKQLAEASQSLVDRLAIELQEARVLTAHLAQLAVALHAAERDTAAVEALDRMVHDRLEPVSGLLHVSPDDAGIEMSPWIPLALLAGATVGDLGPARTGVLRRLLPSSR